MYTHTHIRIYIYIHTYIMQDIVNVKYYIIYCRVIAYGVVHKID